jgi:hypothetical protein
MTIYPSFLLNCKDLFLLSDLYPRARPLSPASALGYLGQETKEHAHEL